MAGYYSINNRGASAHAHYGLLFALLCYVTVRIRVRVKVRVGVQKRESVRAVFHFPNFFLLDLFVFSCFRNLRVSSMK